MATPNDDGINDEVVFEFAVVLAQTSRAVEMEIYDLSGRLVRRLTEERKITYATNPMGANFGDINGDGWLDFYLATGDVPYSELRPNVMYVSQGGERFANVTISGGFGHLQKGHGVSFADIDNDGDQDLYVQTGGQLPGDHYHDALFENPGFNHHWITVKLTGRQSNRSAIAAAPGSLMREAITVAAYLSAAMSTWTPSNLGLENVIGVRVVRISVPTVMA